MKRLWMVKGAAASLTGAALLATAGNASAQACSSITNKVVISGSTAIQSVIAALGPIVGTGSNPITIVYYGAGSCAGLVDVTGTGDSATTWVTYAGSSTAGSCTNAGPLPVDIGASDVYPETCINAGQLTAPTSGTYHDFTGPIQAMTFAVPTASGETSISAEAAFAILGWAGSGMYDVMPWTASPNTSTANIFIRSGTSGTLQMIASEIGLPASDWKGTVESSGGNVVSGLNASSTPDAAIGIAASQSVQLATTPPRILAFQAKGQECGYLPDSTATSRDKLNVREGRYDIWGPEHFYTAVNSSNVPTSANAATVINAISLATVGAASQAVIQAEITAGVTPQCAMRVSRTAEVGPETSFQPTGSCSCFFEANVPGGSTTCHACTTDNDCTGQTGAPKCNYGYCEAM